MRTVRSSRNVRPGSRPTRSRIVSGGGGGGGGAAAYFGTTLLLASTTTGTLVCPDEAVTGDKLIIICHRNSSTLNATPWLNEPSGYTRHASEDFATSGRTAVWTKTATGDGTANNVSVTNNQGDSSANRSIWTMVVVPGGGTVGSVALGFSNKSGWTYSGGDMTAFPVPAGSAGTLIMWGGGLLGGSQQPESIYTVDGGTVTEGTHYFTTGGNNYEKSIGAGAWDGTADAGASITNIGATTHTYAGCLAVS